MNIFIRKARTEEDLTIVFNVRKIWHKTHFNHYEQVTDKYDYATNVTLLLAEDEFQNAVGTMRILDRRCGRIELDDFIEVDSLLTGSEKPCAEASRFWIPKHLKSKLIRFLLWKTFFQYCQMNQIKTILISGRPSAAKFYQRMFFFENAGPLGAHYYRAQENAEVYYTYKCNIHRTWRLMKATEHPLYGFFCVENHPNIKLGDFKLPPSDWRKKGSPSAQKNVY